MAELSVKLKSHFHTCDKLSLNCFRRSSVVIKKTYGMLG